MGWFSDKGKEGTFLEGRASSEHRHKDGSWGRDIEAYRNTYKEGKEVSSEKAPDWGKDHESSDSGK